jgi:hypothetical protein
MTIEQLTPEEAYKWLTKIMSNCRNDELEQIIATDPQWAYYYAYDVIKGRWELGEPTIATDTLWAYMYAVTIIKERWEQGEPVIATIPDYACYYAIYVIKGRFELGEPTIKQSNYWGRYCKEFEIK